MNNQHTSTTPNLLLPSLSVSYRNTQDNLSDLQLIPEAIIVTDAALIVTSINSLAQYHFGRTTQEVTGQPLIEVFGFELIGTNLATLMGILNSTGQWKGDLIFKNAQQEKIIFNSHFTLLKDAGGQPSSIVIVQYNITDKYKREKQLSRTVIRYETLLDSLSEGVIIINQKGQIDRANDKAAQILGIAPEHLKGISIADGNWNAIREDGSPFLTCDFPSLDTLQTGREHNNVIMGITNLAGLQKWVSINSRAIKNDHAVLPEAVITSFYDITEFRETNQRLSQSELLFSLFMKNSPTLGWIYDEDHHFIYGNPLFMDIVGIDDTAVGKKVNELVHYPELLQMIVERNQQVLKTGESVVGEDVVKDKNGDTRYYLSYWFLLPMKGNKHLIGGHAVEITENKKAAAAIDQMHERYRLAISASADAIWDFDIASNTFYYSDTFTTLTGYSRDEITASLEWWLNKIHPEDRKKVKVRLDSYFQNGTEHWEYEYRFQVADGSYKYLLDKALAIYENRRFTKVIGAMQDITERKNLESRLLYEQVQKQKLINKATIDVQEKERNRISAELHDNVNQLLMSANLHIGVAKLKTDNQDDMLAKASQYLLMAVEEIRNLSKTLNANIIEVVGLQKSINDIASNLQLSQQIQVAVNVDAVTESMMNAEQQLMVYRIVQEQTNNILKYAAASEVYISLRSIDQTIELLISDNGKGFNKKEQKASGIGFINIFNRVDAHNGKVSITSSPGNGCLLEVHFPLSKQVMK